MKLLMMGDLHSSYDRPRNRVDEWMSTMQSKFEQIIKIYKDNKCEATLCLGDVCHKHHNIELDYFFSMLYSFFSSMNSHTLIGNHCSKSASGDLENTSLGALVASGAIKINGIKDIDCFDFYKRDEFYKTIKSSNRIASIHDYITPKAQQFPFETKEFDDLVLPYDLVIAGHLHEPLDYTRKDGKRLYNTGCVLRRTIAETHIPKVSILDTETLEIKEIPLNVKPFDEVFKKKEEDQTVHLATDIITQIGQDREQSGLSIEQKIETYAMKKIVSKNIVEEGLKRLGKAKGKVNKK